MSFFIDGIDTMQYGVEIRKGANIALLAPPIFKERYSYDWADGNGLEFDPTEVLQKKEQSFTIPMLVTGLDKVDVVNKYKAFLAVIINSEGFDLNSDVVIDPVHLYYTGGTITDLYNTAMALTLTFTTNFEDAYTYEFLTTNNGTPITINNRKIIMKNK